MISGIYQSKQEFDRDECCFRRTYLLIENDAYIFLSNMVEGYPVTAASVKNSSNCWSSENRFIEPECELVFSRARTHPDLFLKVKTEKDCFVVADPDQDEWGGFGGTYERVI